MANFSESQGQHVCQKKVGPAANAAGSVSHTTFWILQKQHWTLGAYSGVSKLMTQHPAVLPESEKDAVHPSRSRLHTPGMQPVT